MKYIYTLLIVAILSIGLSGCARDTLVAVHYKQRICPEPKTKPIPMKYEVVQLKINDIVYYAIEKSDAVKLAANWISYQEWAETNYKILLEAYNASNASNASKKSDKVLSKLSKSSKQQ